MPTPLQCCDMLKGASLGDPRLVGAAAARAEGKTVATADSSPSNASLNCYAFAAMCLCLFKSEDG